MAEGGMKGHRTAYVISHKSRGVCLLVTTGSGPHALSQVKVFVVASQSCRGIEGFWSGVTARERRANEGWYAVNVPLPYILYPRSLHWIIGQ